MGFHCLKLQVFFEIVGGTTENICKLSKTYHYSFSVVRFVGASHIRGLHTQMRATADHLLVKRLVVSSLAGPVSNLHTQLSSSKTLGFVCSSWLLVGSIKNSSGCNAVCPKQLTFCMILISSLKPSNIPRTH